jgi:hypothetical protein
MAKHRRHRFLAEPVLEVRLYEGMPAEIFQAITDLQQAMLKHQMPGFTEVGRVGLWDLYHLLLSRGEVGALAKSESAWEALMRKSAPWYDKLKSELYCSHCKTSPEGCHNSGGYSTYHPLSCTVSLESLGRLRRIDLDQLDACTRDRLWDFISRIKRDPRHQTDSDKALVATASS